MPGSPSPPRMSPGASPNAKATASSGGGGSSTSTSPAELEKRRAALRNVFQRMIDANNTLGEDEAEPAGKSKAQQQQPAGTTAATTPGAAAGPGSSPLLPPQQQGASRFQKSGGATFTSSGRPVILSAGSRQLPAVFREQRTAVRQIDTVLGNVQQTVQQLVRDQASGREDAALPPDTELLLEENHAAYVKELDSGGETQRRRRGGGTHALRRGGGLPESEWQYRVRRARAAAADDVPTDGAEALERSVGDYAAEAPMPPYVTDTTLGDDIRRMQHALEVLAECTAAMEALLDGGGGGGGDGDGGAARRGAAWWASAARTRQMKTHSIRANYHARAALRWDWRALNHLLLQSVALNKYAERSRAELVALNDHLAALATRTADSEQRVAVVQADHARMQAALAEAHQRRAAARAEMIAAAAEAALVPPGETSPVVAELALLLSRFADVAPHALQEDLAAVSGWLAANSVSLEM